MGRTRHRVLVNARLWEETAAYEVVLPARRGDQDAAVLGQLRHFSEVRRQIFYLLLRLYNDQQVVLPLVHRVDFSHAQQFPHLIAFPHFFRPVSGEVQLIFPLAQHADGEFARFHSVERHLLQPALATPVHDVGGGQRSVATEADFRRRRKPANGKFARPLDDDEGGFRKIIFRCNRLHYGILKKGRQGDHRGGVATKHTAGKSVHLVNRKIVHS